MATLEERVERLESVLTKQKPIYINTDGNWEEVDLWEFEPTAPFTNNLEARVSYLEQLLIEQKPIYINIDGNFEELNLYTS